MLSLTKSFVFVFVNRKKHWFAEPTRPDPTRPTCVNSLMLLNVRQLFERLVAVGARVLAHVAVHQRVLRQLLRRRERLETLAALVALLLHAMRLLGVTLHVRLVGELLPHSFGVISS